MAQHSLTQFDSVGIRKAICCVPVVSLETAGDQALRLVVQQAEHYTSQASVKEAISISGQVLVSMNQLDMMV